MHINIYLLSLFFLKIIFLVKYWWSLCYLTIAYVFALFVDLQLVKGLDDNVRALYIAFRSA